MGNNNGTLDKCEKIGFKVIEVENGSPGERCGLTPYVDFIINVNGYPLHTMTKDAIEYLVKRSENQTLQIEVYDITKSSSRMVDITPSRDWPGEGLLGIVIRLEQYEADSNGEVKPQAEIDVSFDNIYNDLEASPDRSKGNESTAKQRGSHVFSRKSFTSGNNSGSSGDLSPKTSSSIYLSNPAFEDSENNISAETPSPANRRSSGSSKLFKAFNFSPKAGTPSTEAASNDGNYDEGGASRRVSFSPSSPPTDGDRKEKRKSSGVFRKFSFTS